LEHHYWFSPLQQKFENYSGIPCSNNMESVVSMRSNEAEEFPCTSERGLYDDVVQETDRIIGQIPEKLNN
jgi:hypothetical protein